MDNVTAIARQPAPEWTDEQRNLIKRTVAPDATNDELAMFLHVAKKAGLDPLQKQVWFVKRSGRVTVQAGVDGLQARALRMPDCEGISSAAVYEKEEFLFDKAKGEVVKHQSNPFGQMGALIGAWGIVRRKGKTPFCALVRFAEYADSNSPLWKNKPSVMIEKVARSTALRRAYPEEFGGIYDPAEMGSAAHTEEPEHVSAPAAAGALPARAVEAEVVEVKAEQPKPEAPKPTPAYVSALWARAQKTHGGNAGTKWQSAAKEAGITTPSREWSADECLQVERVLFADADIEF